jgi:hypothetical protein
LQKHDLDCADNEVLPMDIKNKLEPIVDVSFVQQSDLADRLQSLLSIEERHRFSSPVMQLAELPRNHPDRCGGGMEVIAILLLSSSGAQATASDVFHGRTLDRMLALQRDDGSWMPGGQFLSLRRWSLNIAEQNTTIWSVLALAQSGEPSPRLISSIDRGKAFLRAQPEHSEHREWLAMRVLYESKLGAMESARRLGEQALAAQQSDGGWGWEQGAESDPYSTGLMLYVLSHCRFATENSTREGKRYLLSGQRPDGSWTTPSQLFSRSAPHHELDAIYDYWGTAWATLGLIETIEIKGPQVE